MTEPQPKSHLIIGLIGQAGSGKDSAALLLLQHWKLAGHVAFVTSFADPIRAMCREFLLHAGVQHPDRYLFDRELKETIIPEIGVSYRHLAQTLGTEWGQQCIGRDAWIRALDYRMKTHCNHGGTHFVVPDVRFTFEADWLCSQGGVIWRIERPGVAPVRAHVSESESTHISSHRVILNDGTLTDLAQTVGFELTRLKHERGLA